MAARIVRQSKFRHVFGAAAKPEKSYFDFKIGRTAWDSNKVYANASFVACLWEAQGGGSFCVIPSTQYGKLHPSQALFSGHKAAVLDLGFSPFNDSIIASGADDAYVKVWQIPAGGAKETQREALQNLIGHRRKVGTVDFHPVAENVLATSSADFEVKIWDITTGKANVTIGGHADLIQSFAWNYNGSAYATSCKDKNVRIFDPRSGAESFKVEAHDGNKGSRVTFLGDKEKLFTVGFSKMSERQLAIWDPRNPGKALKAMNIDTASGQIIPFYDNDTALVFLGGKGDGNIRYYEIVDDSEQIYYVSEFKSQTPTLGLALFPKYALDFADCEVVRLLKGHNGGIQPVNFTVPRKSDLFQDDIYPDTPGQDPALTASAWFGGANAEPKKINLSGGFVPKEKPADLQVQKVEEAKPLSAVELSAENERLTKRVAYLEAELRKRDPSWSS